MRRTAVLIAGAGPTGLTLACALRMRGVSVIVIDAADGPATTSRALGLQPRGVEVLNRVGALGDLPAQALPALDMTVHLGSSRPIRIPVGEPGKAAALLISQAKIEGRLRDRLAEPWSGANQIPGVQVTWAHKLVGAETDADGVTAEVRSPNGIVRIRVDWLVGCDGAHSAVRKLAGIGFTGDTVVENILLADVRADWPMSRTGSTMWITPERNVGVIPLPDGSWRLFTALDDDGAEAWAAGKELATSTFPAIAGTTPADGVEWASIFRVHQRLADRYRAGRLLLAGDAAHIHSPAGGQGMNTGIGDAENLAWKLATVIGGADDRLLDTYEAERRPVAAKVLSGTTTATKLIMKQGALSGFVRDNVLAPLLGLRSVRGRILRVASQLGVTYRGGPLAPAGHGIRPRPGPRPGDRIPDLACRRSDGTATTLHLACRAGWVILAGAEVDTAKVLAEVRSRVGPHVTVVHPANEKMRGCLLVRPDAHLAVRAGADGVRVLGRWLDEVLFA